MKLDPAVLAFATPSERKAADAVERCGGVRAAARELGWHHSTVQQKLRQVERRAARQGVSPVHDMTKPVPEGFHLKGTSTLYDADGKARLQWVKTQIDKDEQLRLLIDAIQTIAEPLPKFEPVKAPKRCVADLLCVYPMGDPHLGMFSWAEETGCDFDLKIAERNLVRAVDQLVDLAPAAEEALIINLGDFFHSDSKENRTARSGHALDVDTRWPKVLSAGLRAMKRCIDGALRKHKRVTVICEIGNHDDHSAIMLAIALNETYSREPRVTIDTSPAKFHWYRFGKNLIGVTHGDTVKPAALPEIMACDRARDWGETEHRYWYTGHVHHESVKEYRGCVVETFRTLAPRDSWHHANGYRAGRDMRVDVLHREHGRRDRYIVSVEQLK